MPIIAVRNLQSGSVIERTCPKVNRSCSRYLSDVVPTRVSRTERLSSKPSIVFGASAYSHLNGSAGSNSLDTSPAKSLAPIMSNDFTDASGVKSSLSRLAQKMYGRMVDSK